MCGEQAHTARATPESFRGCFGALESILLRFHNPRQLPRQHLRTRSESHPGVYVFRIAELAHLPIAPEFRCPMWGPKGANFTTFFALEPPCPAKGRRIDCRRLVTVKKDGSEAGQRGTRHQGSGLGLRTNVATILVQIAVR